MTPRPPIPALLGHTVEIADMDFETFSTAGFIWNEADGKWRPPSGAPKGKSGLFVVGAARYTEDPSCEVLSFSYDLKDGHGPRLWMPGWPPPVPLFEHLAAGRLIEAWNVAFERWVWRNVCVPKYGWPPLPDRQLRCAMAKSRAAQYPGALSEASEVVLGVNLKDAEGKRLLDKFSKPRNPTKKDARRCITLADDPVDGARLIAYNTQDIRAEAAVSHAVPDLTGIDLEYWFVDQAVNMRGVAIDMDGVRDCVAIVEQAHAKYNAELFAITGIDAASKVQQIQGWLHAQGCHLDSLDEEAVTTELERLGEVLQTGGAVWPEVAHVYRVLQIRQAIGSAAVKKLYAISNQVTADGRLHDLFSFHATRTGRATGNGPQPTNLPNSGPNLWLCECGKYFALSHRSCPWCLALVDGAVSKG